MKYLYGIFAMFFVTALMAYLQRFTSFDIMYIAGSWSMLAYLIIIGRYKAPVSSKEDTILKEFLVYQIIVTKDQIYDTRVNCLIRRVLAKNNNEAIGVFSEETKLIECKKKLSIDCIELNNLIKL